MDYLGVAKRAWDITKKYRFLWWLGILAAATEMGGFNVPSFPSNTFELNGNNLSISSGTVSQLGNGLTSGQDSTVIFLVIALVSIAIIAVSLILLFLSLCANAGIIHGADSADAKDHEKLNFGHCFGKGIDYFWRFLGLKILVGLIPLAVFIGLAFAGIFLLFTSGIFSLISLPMLIILAMIILLPLGIYLSLLEIFSRRAIVIKNKGIINSIKESHKLIVKEMGSVLLFWLIRAGVGIAYLVSILVILFALLTPLVLLGFSIYSLAEWSGVGIYAIIASGIVLLGLIFIGGIFTAFTSSYWTLAYKEFVKD